MRPLLERQRQCAGSRHCPERPEITAKPPRTPRLAKDTVSEPDTNPLKSRRPHRGPIKRILGGPLACLAAWRWIWGTVVVFAIACGDGNEPGSPENAVPEPPKDALAKTTEHGPVKATVKVWPATPSLGEPIYARLEVEAPPGVQIEAPYQEAGDQKLGRFAVVGFVRDTRRTPTGGQVHEQTYTLEAQTSGRHRVPPLRLEMIDSRTPDKSGDKNKAQEILTDEIALEVAPVKTEALGKELAPAAGTLDPDVGGTSWLFVLGIASIVLVLGSGSILLVRALGARRRIEQQRSAYDEAVSQLRALEDRGAPDAEAADSWFVELSAIVRRYLEQRYEIRAPELTTEEFLLVATARPELGPEHRALLTQFLERCDRVKFAGYRPDAEESLATLKAARGFVEDTRLQLPRAA
jgi:hypothetical protein